METTQKPILNIYQRINEVMKDVDYIQKDAKKVAGQYRFVSHDSVTAALHGPMTKHGIACIPSIIEMKQDGNRTEVKLEVSFINIDNPTDKFSVVYYGHGIDSGDKGIGKAVSYGFKYALLKTFVLETGDDPDEDQASVYVPPKPKEQSFTQEDYDGYISSFGGDSLKMMQYIQFVADAKKCSLLEAGAMCKRNHESTLKGFEKWKEKQK